VCAAVEGLFLGDPDVHALGASAERAQRDGVDVVFLVDGPLGDAIVITAGLAAALAVRAGSGDQLPELLLGVRQSLGPEPHRHPTVLAREMTTLDHVTGGRVLLAFTGPFTDAVCAATLEAVTLCRDMWRTGMGVGTGQRYPAAGAVNLPLPQRPGGPPIALDLTDGSIPNGVLLGACDLVLVPVGALPPDALPPGVGVCWIRGPITA
jgi:alkanesulfonate monooxygenase SsuD/methylene tetrahydromethanopterin reductase-like flavin-dependent oxidoreductase (luciferase family)